MTGFRPYFYVPADQAEALPASSHVSLETGTSYRSIRGESLRRLFTQNPGDVRQEREQFRHYEADIPFATRFMIDTGLTGGVSAPSTEADYKELAPADVEAPARSCIIDIECEDERGFPDPQRDAIIAITAFDSFPGDYTTFLLVGGGIPATIAEKQAAGGLANGCFRKENHTICTYGGRDRDAEGFCPVHHRTRPGRPLRVELYRVRHAVHQPEDGASRPPVLTTRPPLRA